MSRRGSSGNPEATRLFPELLQEVFTHLSVRDLGAAARVCRYWRDIAYDKRLWRGVEAKIHLKDASSSIAGSLGRRGITAVQVLSFRKSLKGLSGQPSPALRSLKLSGLNNVTDRVLASSLLSSLPHLTSLDLSLTKQLSDAAMSRLADFTPNLTTLALGGCYRLTDKGMAAVARLQNLHHLNLRSTNVSDEGIAFLAGRPFPSKDEDSITMTTIEIEEERPLKKCRMDEGGLINLQILNLQDCQKLSDGGMEHLSRLPSLIDLNVSFNVNVSDNGLRSLGSAKCLQRLCLRACENISDSGLGSLVHLGLTHLDLSFCDKVRSLQWVGTPTLRELRLSACPISDPALLRVGLRAEKLEVLEIGQCLALTEKSVGVLADKLPRLRYLDLYGCPGVGKAINSLLRLKSLERINLGLVKLK